MDLLSFRKAFSEVEGGVLTKLQPCVRYKVTHKALKQTVNKTRVSQYNRFFFSGGGGRFE